MLCCCGHVLFISERDEHDGDDHADGYAEKCETADTFAPATYFLEADWEGAEEHVERAVDYCHVDRQYKDDRLFEKEDPGADEGRAEGLLACDSAFGVFFCSVDFIGQRR